MKGYMALKAGRDNQGLPGRALSREEACLNGKEIEGIQGAPFIQQVRRASGNTRNVISQQLVSEG